MEELDIISQVQQYGFPIILALGLGYFIYYVWWFISEHIEPEIERYAYCIDKSNRPNKDVRPRPYQTSTKS